MPIYDMECPSCGNIHEAYSGIDEDPIQCPNCGSDTKRIISASGQYCSNQDAGWLKNVLEVVDKSDNTIASKEFLANPTRRNYKAWMKAKGLRPIEDGENRRKQAPWRPPTKTLLDRVMERRRIEI